MRTIIQVIGISFVIFLSGYAGWIVRDVSGRAGISSAPIARPAHILSLSEIQELIGAVPDGVYGPETREKWELAINTQFAEKYMTESGRPK